MFHDSHKKVSTSDAAAVRSPPDCDSNPDLPTVSANSCAASCWAGRCFRDVTAVMGITPCSFSQSIALLTLYWGHDTIKWAWFSIILGQNGQDFIPGVFLSGYLEIPLNLFLELSYFCPQAEFQAFCAVRLPTFRYCLGTSDFRQGSLCCSSSHTIV